MIICGKNIYLYIYIYDSMWVLKRLLKDYLSRYRCGGSTIYMYRNIIYLDIDVVALAALVAAKSIYIYIYIYIHIHIYMFTSIKM
jgi:hypothetical protein